MIGSPHLAAKPLADLCHRLALSAEAGIDIRKTWLREEQSARGRLAAPFQKVREAVDAGDSLAEGLARTGSLFPPLFHEMVGVGELSGALPHVLHRLSEHYQGIHDRRRAFRSRLAWPMIELTGAVVIIGLLIYILGALGATNLRGEPIDVLGLGVVGLSGLAAYIFLVLLAVATIALVVGLFRRGVLWTRPVAALLMRLPVIGPALEQIALARLAWSLHLMLNTSLDLRRIIPLALRSSGNPVYGAVAEQVTAGVVRGMPLNQALASTGVFPTHFLDVLQVAEESGQMVESLGRFSKQQQEEADHALANLSTVLSFAIWGAVMLLITVMIVRLFKIVYLDTINDAMNL